MIWLSSKFIYLFVHSYLRMSYEKIDWGAFCPEVGILYFLTIKVCVGEELAVSLGRRSSKCEKAGVFLPGYFNSLEKNSHFLPGT